MGAERSRVDDERPTPEAMLERARREAGTGARGRLHVYLGMAPGVGKTYKMLLDARQRRAAGADVVVAIVETHGRPLTAEAIGDLEVIPRRRIEYQGVTIEEMDTAAVIRRRPQIALVDELAHTNAPGSKHAKRWQDVEELREHGITVFSTVNVQHLESLADVVEAITGVRVGERLPDRIVDEADEIELVDISPRALRERLQAGHIYPPDRAAQAAERFFREGNLTALRELALRRIATAVEEDLQEYMRAHRIDAVWPAGERVLVAVAPDGDGPRLLRRGWRLAEALGADMVAVFVEPANWLYAPSHDRLTLEAALRYAEDLGAEVVRLRADDVAAALAGAARDHNAGCIVIGHSHHGRLHHLLHGSIVGRLLRLAPNADVLVVGRRAN